MLEKFSTGKNALEGSINIGIAPGKFDTKQLILSALIVLSFTNNNFKQNIRFVRSTNRNELSKCNLFINDDFTTDFPAIPSYHNIEESWRKSSSNILNRQFVNDLDIRDVIDEIVCERLYNLESIDALMYLYEPSYSENKDTFKDALDVTIKLINRIIKDAIKSSMLILTFDVYIKKAKANYIIMPIYTNCWQDIVCNIDKLNKIEYAIFEDNSEYLIECINKDIVMKKYVKGLKGVVYSGRFFVRVSNLEIAKQVIERLPNFYAKNNIVSA